MRSFRHLLCLLAILASSFSVIANELDMTEPEIHENKLDPPYWPSGHFLWFYSDSNEPDWLNPGEAADLFRHASEAWSSCGLSIEFQGVVSNPVRRHDLTNTMGWAKLPPAYRGITFREKKPGTSFITEADVVMNLSNQDIQNNRKLLAKVILHEFGHALGLLHSEFCSDVMSSAKECGPRIANPPPTKPTDNDLLQCALRYKKNTP